MSESEDPKKVSNNDLRKAQFGGGFINAENVNAQRIGGDIWNFFLGQQLAPVGNPQREHNQRLLLADVKQQVTARLRQSLHNAVLINLGKESQPQQVKRPWDAEIKIGLKPPKPLPDTTTIFEVFDSEEIAGKLLILGAPGSGKTTTLLELAQALTEHAEKEPDYPIPVLLNLSSWKNSWWQYGKQAFLYWLISALNSQYGIKTKQLKEWIENRQILPLLDGLDEIEPSQQKKCISAINHFLRSEARPAYVVICSRVDEYQYSQTQLEVNNAVFLKNLTNVQIENFLIKAECIEFWEQIQQELDLLNLSKNPLLLSISILVYPKLLNNKWHQLNSREERLQSLLDLYIIQMLEERVHRPDQFKNIKQKELVKINSRLWLGWLAKKMQQESQVEFLIENMHPSQMLTSTDRRLYKLIIVSLCGLAGLLIGGIALGFIIGFRITVNTDNADDKDKNKERSKTQFFWGSLVGGLIGGASGILSISLSGLILGIIVGLNIKHDEIEITESFDFHLTIEKRQRLKGEIIKGMKWACSRIFILSWFYLLIGLIILIGALILINYKVFVPDYNSLLVILIYFVVQTFTLIFTLGMFFALIRLFRTEIQNKMHPNQGIRESIKITIFLSITLFIISTILFVLNGFNLLYFLLPVVLEPISDFCFAGVACIQHLALRYVLYLRGYIPWNYARFLDYCTERLLLQRVGGRYRFIHKLLQDHFAQMPFDRTVD